MSPRKEHPDAIEAERDELRSALLAVAASAHRAKWSYDDTPAPTGCPRPFDFLHRLGDQAKDALAKHTPTGDKP